MVERFPAPETFFGFGPGTAGKLAGWEQLVSYYRLAADHSDCVGVVDLGKTTEGRDYIGVIISSPDNVAKSDALRSFQDKLADPRRASAEDHAEAVRNGRAVVMINCSMHPAEAGAAQAAVRLLHELVTGDDEESRSILDNVVVLLVPSMNPDGLELVRKWYEETLGTPAEGTWPPSITHRYCGGDNSYDWATLTQVEARQLVERFFNVWHPHVFLDLHQMEPDSFRCILPPGVDPVDPLVDPVIRAQMASFGPEIATRMTAAGLPGVATGIYFGSSSADHDYARYHNCIYLLTEVASSELASTVTLKGPLQPLDGFDPSRPSGNHPMPWTGSRWSFADVVEYDLAIMRGCLAIAAAKRQELVRNFAQAQRRACAAGGVGGYLIDTTGEGEEAARDVVGFLQTGGVEIMRLAGDARVGDALFAAGTLYVPLAQPASPFARALLDPLPYPPSAVDANSRARATNRSAAFHLPLLTGLRVTRTNDGGRLPLMPFHASPPLVTADSLPAGASHFVCEPGSNAAAHAVNLLLKEGATVERLTADTELDGRNLRAGAFVASGLAPSLVGEIAGATGTRWQALRASVTDSALHPVRLPRLGVYKSYLTGFGVCDEGWLRFVLDTHAFPFTTLHNDDIRERDLGADFDVVLLPQQLPRDIVLGYDPRRFQGAAPEVEEPGLGMAADLPESPYPARYRGGIGPEGMSNLRGFAEQGGTVIGIDAASNVVIESLGLPVRNVLRDVPRKTLNIPGSLVRLEVDPAHPIGYGYPDGAVGVFLHSPAFETDAGAAVVARHARAGNVVAGWAEGAQMLAGLPALVDVPVGRGRAVLFGFRPYHRAQARNTYRLLFNALYRASCGGRPARRSSETDGIAASFQLQTAVSTQGVLQ